MYRLEYAYSDTQPSTLSYLENWTLFSDFVDVLKEDILSEVKLIRRKFRKDNNFRWLPSTIVILRNMGVDENLIITKRELEINKKKEIIIKRRRNNIKRRVLKKHNLQNNEKLIDDIEKEYGGGKFIEKSDNMWLEEIKIFEQKTGALIEENCELKEVIKTIKKYVAKMEV